MAGIIGRKIGMSSFFDEKGKNIPCTMVEAGPCIVTQIKDVDIDGYSSVQLGFDDKKPFRTTKSELGHAKKANTSAKKMYSEFENNFIKTNEDGVASFREFKLGDVVNVELFKEGEYVDVTSTSKGKGFQGLLKDMVLLVLEMLLMDNIIE